MFAYQPRRSGHDLGPGFLASAAPSMAPRWPAPPYPAAAPRPNHILTRVERNGPTARLVGSWWIRGLPLTLPQAFRVARELAPQLTPDPDSLVVIELVDRVGSPPPLSLTGTVTRSRGRGSLVDRSPGLIWVWLESDGELPAADSVAESVPAAAWEDPALGARLGGHPAVFAGGLISISAEPPEGFFAAATAAELKAAGHRLAPADEAEVWLYRVPDSRPESYFEFTYPSPDRPEPDAYHDKFLIACGLGPANDPDSEGGREADLLWLGDEQHGPLVDYLRVLARPDLRLSHLRRTPGTALRLADGSCLLNAVDRRHGLTRLGFEALKTDPELYRRVYSREYDAFLATLFEPLEGRARGSYLLATSRGCSQGCAICCSGGLSAFQYFSAPRMLEELARLSWHERLRPWEQLDIYFLDSNFNNHPGRLIQFAQLYKRSRLYGRFRFFVRHNTVNGFLLPPDAEGVKRPNLELIEAFRSLGIREIWMGVDTYDDASTLTLKSHRQLLVKRGSEARPTYTFAELQGLVEALQASGARIKGFYLSNNPWVSDFDRLDSYFNLLTLWLNCPDFSIDARERQVNQLKPFPGSPIERVARELPETVIWGRFRSHGPLGELDEQVDMSRFGQPRSQSDLDQVLAGFHHDMGALRAAAAEVGADSLLAKLDERERSLLTVLGTLPGTAARTYAAEIAARPARVFDPEQQAQAFRSASASLISGLARVAGALSVGSA